MKGGAPKNAVAEMADRQRVVHRRVVAFHRIEIRAQQERRTAGDRHPHLRRCVRLRERLAVGARDAGAGPCRIGPAAARSPAGAADLIAPMLAAVILAAVEQIARAGAERVVGLAERRDAAVLVVVHADIEPDFRHPLRVAHRAGPGAAHFLRRAPAAVDDFQRVDQLGFPIGAAARFVPGQRCQRRKDRAHMVLLHQADRHRLIQRPTAPAACRARRQNPARSARTAPRASSGPRGR